MLQGRHPVSEQKVVSTVCCCPALCMCHPCCREDIPLAAVDFHVAPGLTQHLAAQPQVKAAARGLAATNAAGEIRTRDGAHSTASCPVLAVALATLGAARDCHVCLCTYICRQHRFSWEVACYMDMHVVLIGVMTCCLPCLAAGCPCMSVSTHCVSVKCASRLD